MSNCGGRWNLSLACLSLSSPAVSSLLPPQHYPKILTTASNNFTNMAPAPDPTRTDSSTSLKADYTSPNTTRTFAHPLPPASNKSTKEKTMYLSALRKSVVELQDEVNGFLTTKMEEDKALAANVGMKADDKVEEENYGEEKVEDDG